MGVDVPVVDKPGHGRGFVPSFAETLRSRGAADHDPGAVMGYYGAAEVPVFDDPYSRRPACRGWPRSVPSCAMPAEH